MQDTGSESDANSSEEFTRAEGEGGAVYAINVRDIATYTVQAATD